MAGQNNGPKRYDFLEELSMNELEELLRKSAELQPDNEDAFVDAIAEVIMRKEKENPTGRLPDIEEAWREFQTHYNTPEGQGMSLYPDEEDDGKEQAAPPTAKKRRRVFTFRNLAAAAAVIILCIVTILPPALGYENVFVMIGDWNDSFFHFVMSGGNADPTEDPTEETYASLQEALDRNGVSVPVAPKVSDRFKSIMVEVVRYPEYQRIDYTAFYRADEDNMSIYIIQRDKPVKSRSYEKDGTLVEIYPVNEIEHYIYENNGRISITWYTDVFECFVQADISTEEAIELVDSIYEGS